LVAGRIDQLEKNMINLRKTVMTLTCVAAAAGSLVVAEPVTGFSPVEAKTCQANMTGPTGRATNLERAKRRARIKWEVAARIKYGWQYNSWQIAESRGYNQKKKLGVWRVNAKARPCKS
jgi:hypothetical protein